MDLKKDTNDGLRFRTDIFPSEYPPVVYSEISDEACEIQLSRPLRAQNAEPRLRKSLITNCNKELVNCISECVANVLNSNIKLLVCNTRKDAKIQGHDLKVAYRHFTLSGKKRLIVQHRGFLLPLLGALLPTIANLIFRYLVSADHYHSRDKRRSLIDSPRENPRGRIKKPSV